MEIKRVEALSECIVQAYAWGDVAWHVWRAHPGHQPNTERLIAGVSSNFSDKPLVLLHGGSGSWTHWVRNVERFAQRRSVWVLDIPGFGDSSLPEGVSDADGLVPYLAEILKRTFAGEAVDVVGFSFGGMTAGLMAAEYPELIRQLVLVGAPGLGLFGKELPMRGMTPNMDEAAQRNVHQHNLNAMMFAHPETITEQVIDMQQANVARDRLRRRRIARTDVLTKVQHRWACPVHGVWGEFDALYQDTLIQVPEVLSCLKSFHVVCDAGHWVMYERPDDFHAVIDGLLQH